MEVHTTGPDASLLVTHANDAQQAHHFSTQPIPGAIPLHLTPIGDRAPYAAHPITGVRVSTAQSQGISTYARIPRQDYLLVTAMLGITQYLALLRNSFLIPEDLLRQTPCRCLFKPTLFIEDFASAFDNPHLCRQCAMFYEALCHPEEIQALLATIQRIQKTAPCAA